MKHTTKKVKNIDGTKVTRTEHPFEGLPDADERLAKAIIATEINRRISKRALKQKDAAKLLGITQPEVSNLGNGRLAGFTFDRLYRCLNALNVDVEISFKSVRRRKNKQGHVSVTIAS